MSDDAETRYWQDQHDKHGPGALPSDFELHPERQAEQQQAAAVYEQAALAPPQEPIYDETYADETPWEAPSYGYADELPQPPDAFSETYQQDMEEYLDARDQLQYGQQVDLAEQQAWLEENRAQRQAQAEMQAIDSERQFQQDLPDAIGRIIGKGETGMEAGQMLAPAVFELGEATANELLRGLVAEGLSQEEAMSTLAEIYPQLLESTVQQVRTAYGTQTAFAEARAQYFPNTRR